MRLGTYTLEQGPSSGWPGVTREPRVIVTPTLGGVRVTSLQGHPGDESVRLMFNALDARPAKALIRTYPDTDVEADFVGGGEKVAYKIPVAAGGFAAISAARIRLKTVSLVGRLKVEIWDNLNAFPGKRVGLIGVLEAGDVGPAYANIDLFALTAWPIGEPRGWLVLNGDEMSAGNVSWAGEVGTPDAHAKDSGAGWVLTSGELSGTVWQGGQGLVLQGLVSAYDGEGLSLEADLDDGQLYTVRPARLAKAWGLTPTVLGDQARMVQVRLDIAVSAET